MCTSSPRFANERDVLMVVDAPIGRFFAESDNPSELVQVAPGTVVAFPSLPLEFVGDHSLDTGTNQATFIYHQDKDLVGTTGYFSFLLKDICLADMPLGVQLVVVQILGCMPGAPKRHEAEEEIAA